MTACGPDARIRRRALWAATKASKSEGRRMTQAHRASRELEREKRKASRNGGRARTRG